MIPVWHDHVGFMVFEEDECWCTECGAQWRRDLKGWHVAIAGVHAPSR